MVAPVQVRLLDFKPVIRSVAMELDERVSGVHASLLKTAVQIQRRAIANAATKHYDGRLEKNVEWWDSFHTSTYYRISVGIKPGKFVPEGATFEKGWRSEKGLQPPTAPFAEWALRRGIAKTKRDARSIGFILAQKQGQRPGYKFDQFHWLKDAFDAERDTALATAISFGLKVNGGGPARGAGGRFIKASM